MRPTVSSSSMHISTPLLLLALLTACGQAPVPVDSNAGQATAPSRFSDTKTLPDGHPTGMTHPGLEGAASTDAVFSGSVRLEGELAKREGFVFVNVMPEGVRMPCYSRKYSLAAIDDKTIRQDGDALVIDFVLDKNYELGGLVPGQLTLEACFDPDGYVDTKEPSRVVQTRSTKAGEAGIEVTLKRSDSE